MTGYRTRENVNVEAVVDKSGAALGIEFAHEATHRDVLVTASDYVADVDIAAPLVYLIKAPAAGNENHPAIIIGASGPCLIELYQGAAVSANGTAALHMRHNWGSAKATASALFRGPTVTDNGTKKYTTRLPGTTGGNPSARIGGQSRNGEEIVQPTAVNGLLVITPEANDTKVWIEMEYYEVAV